MTRAGTVNCLIFSWRWFWYCISCWFPLAFATMYCSLVSKIALAGNWSTKGCAWDMSWHSKSRWDASITLPAFVTAVQDLVSEVLSWIVKLPGHWG